MCLHSTCHNCLFAWSWAIEGTHACPHGIMVYECFFSHLVACGGQRIGAPTQDNRTTQRRNACVLQSLEWHLNPLGMKQSAVERWPLWLPVKVLCICTYTDRSKVELWQNVRKCTFLVQVYAENYTVCAIFRLTVVFNFCFYVLACDIYCCCHMNS